MKRVMVRYTIKPELVAANAALVEAVFAQLAREQPAGLRYATFRVAGTGTFVHVASIDTPDGAGIRCSRWPRSRRSRNRCASAVASCR